MAGVKKVGLIVGREWSFPPAFIDEVNRRNAGVVAEYAQVEATRIDQPPPYAVLVDRISHDIPHYQPVLKLAALNGTYVVNNPFWRIARDEPSTLLRVRGGYPVEQQRSSGAAAS